MKQWEEKYVINTQFLGGGSFGNVFSATNKIENLEVCVKKIAKKEQFAENILATMCQNEFDIANRLIGKSHENLVKIFDIYYDDSKDTDAYIFMEKCDNNLSKFTKNDLQDDQIDQLILDISNGYCFLIEQKIIHRDFKPENLLFKMKDNKPIFKIADFGLGKLVDDEVYMTKVGTEFYKAPEVDSKKYDNKCDIFSFGVILFELITRRFDKNLFKPQDKRLQTSKFSELYSSHLQTLNLTYVELLDKMICYDASQRISWEELQEWIKNKIQLLNQPLKRNENQEQINLHSQLRNQVNPQSNTFVQQQSIPAQQYYQQSANNQIQTVSAINSKNSHTHNNFPFQPTPQQQGQQLPNNRFQTVAPNNQDSFVPQSLPQQPTQTRFQTQTVSNQGQSAYNNNFPQVQNVRIQSQSEAGQGAQFNLFNKIENPQTQKQPQNFPEFKPTPLKQQQSFNNNNNNLKGLQQLNQQQSPQQESLSLQPQQSPPFLLNAQCAPQSQPSQLKQQMPQFLKQSPQQAQQQPQQLIQQQQSQFSGLPQQLPEQKPNQFYQAQVQQKPIQQFSSLQQQQQPQSLCQSPFQPKQSYSAINQNSNFSQPQTISFNQNLKQNGNFLIRNNDSQFPPNS